jgi:hypothetical protein
MVDISKTQKIFFLLADVLVDDQVWLTSEHGHCICVFAEMN